MRICINGLSLSEALCVAESTRRNRSSEERRLKKLEGLLEKLITFRESQRRGTAAKSDVTRSIARVRNEVNKIRRSLARKGIPLVEAKWNTGDVIFKALEAAGLNPQHEGDLKIKVAPAGSEAGEGWMDAAFHLAKKSLVKAGAKLVQQKRGAIGFDMAGSDVVLEKGMGGLVIVHGE